MATDSSRLALGLAMSNVYRNEVQHLVNVSEVNHMSDLTFGSSLQGFFDGSSQPDAILWRSLDLLLSETNPDAIVLLSHVRTGNERLEVPRDTEREETRLILKSSVVSREMPSMYRPEMVIHLILRLLF